jgi:amino-acid N-acetyltransferase
MMANIAGEPSDVDVRDATEYVIRRARTADVPAIRSLVDAYSADRILLAKEMVTLYEDVQEFWVAADQADELLGCGALHVMWENLAEVRTLATHPSYTGRGIGTALLNRLLAVACELGVVRVFCLTFEAEFFSRNGFEPLAGTPVEPAVYAQLLRSYDEGVAEFLDLDRVKPNTLGNTRMLRRL